MSRAMTVPEPSTADWEAFYRSYRKPGYVAGYEITSKLGGGMFGLVFRARKQSIGKDYAIKFLKVDDGEVRREVLQELEQVKYFAQVDHPNLVSIEDRGEVDGIPYIVMAYAGHETLRDKLREENADRGELLRYFLQACRGVAALHERSLVHFDLKPANVFLKGGVARVGDYGLSKLVAHSRNSLSMGRGTPYYMAPEMLQRRGDHRSDVYSLGVLLFEVLTGDVPFRGDSEWEVLRKHEAEKPRYPAHVEARFRAVLDRCLAKDPADRYESVHDIVSELGAPASVGQAAFEDVRAGVAPGPQVPPPPPRDRAAPPPPSPDDPYAEFRDAARKAQATARQLALEAMQNARTATTKAMRDARSAMQDAVQQFRKGREVRRDRRLHRLQEREARRQEMRARQAPEGWPEIHPRRRHSGSWWGVAAVVVGVAFWLMWSVGPVSGPPARRGVSTVEGPPAPIAPEPALPAMAPGTESVRRSLQAVRREIADLQRNLSSAPLTPSDLVSGLPGAADQQLVEDLREFSAREPYNQRVASGFRDLGYPTVLAAIAVLGETPVDQEAGLRRALNLHRLLEETTGFDRITLRADSAAGQKARVAALWAHFLQRMAPDPRAWSDYLRALGR